MPRERVLHHARLCASIVSSLFCISMIACVPAGDRGARLRVDSGGPRADATNIDPDGGTIEDDAEVMPPEDTGVDAGRNRDARVHPDALVPDVGGECMPHTPPMNGSTGPINLIREEAHGLPGCYRCGLAAADFDGDARIDVVMAGPFDSAFTPGMGGYTYQNRVRVFRNISCPGQEIRFELALEMPNTVGGGGATVITGDFNGDMKPDIAVEFREGDSPASDTASFLNNGNFAFTKRSLGSFDSESTSLGIAGGDFDRDGSDDILIISDGYGAAPGLWYRYNGTNWEARQTNFPHAMSYGGTVTAGDLDGDEYPDIAVGGNSSQPFGQYDCSNTLLYGQIHFNAGQSNPSISGQGLLLGGFAMLADRNNPPACTGMDNAGMLIADMDGDGTNDIVLAGSADAFRGPPPGPPQTNGSHYDFAVLFNRDGTGRNFETWENAGVQYPNGTTNGGTGNMDDPNIAVGDLDGDDLPEAFIQGHHRDYANDAGRYIFNTRLFLNTGRQSFTEVEIGMPEVGEGGQAIADFNNDGKMDLVFAGASIPFHSNGSNPNDNNNTSTLFAYVYRNTRP